ncbi:hypothetical protein V8C44DRAFT_317885 [Trichoderma aethiopicum]
MGRTGRCRARTYESPLHLQKRRRRAGRQWTLQRAGRAAGHWLPDQSTCSSQAAIRRVYLHVPAEPSAATPGFLARPLSLCATSGRRGRGASTQLWARRSTQVDVSGGREASDGADGLHCIASPVSTYQYQHIARHSGTEHRVQYKPATTMMDETGYRGLQLSGLLIVVLEGSVGRDPAATVLELKLKAGAAENGGMALDNGGMDGWI